MLRWDRYRAEGRRKAMKAVTGAESGYTIKLIQRSKLHKTWVEGAKGP